MGRGEKFSRKRNSNRKVRLKDNGSDDSDEDYVVSDEEEEEESEADLEEYCSSLDGEAALEESFDGLVEEEDEELDEVVEEDTRRRKVSRPKGKKGRFGNWKIGGKKSRKRNKVVSDDEDEGEDDADYVDDEEEERRRVRKVGRPKTKAGSLGTEENRRIGSVKRRRVFYDKEDEDGDYEEEKEEDDAEEEERNMEKVGREKGDDEPLGSGENGVITSGEQDGVSRDTEEEDDRDYEDEDEDDDDEEFTPDEDVSLDEEEEEEIAVCNKKKNMLKKAKKTKKQKKRSGQGCKKRKKYSVARKPSRKGGRKKHGQKRKRKSDEDEDGDFIDDSTAVRKKAKKKSSRRRGRYTVASDSDFVSSGASDYEYTISEEEREQVREASKLLSATLRSVSSSKQTQVTEDSHQLQKSPVKKGKEKVEAGKIEVMKQVCGICLSEEDKRRLRGTLDCCSHYFCFTCIMEWSKVESRCPLCKQRFRTISKPARSTLGVDLREVAIPVPERDQVYQPTEEELRSYLDPYENVICTECHQGGDDGLMLLCDLCDSSAHTYCVGLGREVPEGNWYCEGCRPVALGSSSPRAPSPSPEQRMINGWYNRPSPPVISREHLDPSLLASPRTPFFHGFGSLLSPRLPNGDVQASSPSGSGAPTLSRRRTLHRHIQNIINSNRLNSMADRTDGTSVANSSNGFVDQRIECSRETETSQAGKTQEMGTPLYTISEERLRNNNSSSSVQARELLSSRSDHPRREAARDHPANTLAVERPVNLGLWPGLAEHQNSCCIQNTVSVFRVATEGDFSIAREQLQLTVKTHLKNLSRQLDLGQVTFNEIATCSIHTILAACGLEHRSSEVHVVPPPVTCSHGGSGRGGQMGSRSLMKGCCSCCFDSFVKDVVKMIVETRQPHWLSLGL